MPKRVFNAFSSAAAMPHGPFLPQWLFLPLDLIDDHYLRRLLQSISES